MIKEVSDPIYKNRVFFCIGETPKKISNHYQKESGDEHPIDVYFQGWDQSGAMCLNVGGHIYIAMIDHQDLEENLVHEIGHCVLEILINAGFVVDDNEKHEPLCYLLGYYYTACMKHLKDYQAKTVQKGKAKK